MFTFKYNSQTVHLSVLANDYLDGKKNSFRNIFNMTQIYITGKKL